MVTGHQDIRFQGDSYMFEGWASACLSSKCLRVLSTHCNWNMACPIYIHTRARWDGTHPPQRPWLMPCRLGRLLGIVRAVVFEVAVADVEAVELPPGPSHLPNSPWLHSNIRQRLRAVQHASSGDGRSVRGNRSHEKGWQASEFIQQLLAK